MLRLAWRGVLTNKGRYLATIIAILTGVAFFTAARFVSDRVINSLEGDVTRHYGSVDVAVVPEDVSGDQGNLVNQTRIPKSAADRIAQVQGVTASGGVVTGKVGFLGADGKPFAKDAVGRLWIADEDLNPLSMKEGRAPATAGEVAVDQGTAKAHDLAVGSKVTVLTLSGQHPATVVGITRFGDSDSVDQSGTVSLPEATAFDWLTSGRQEYESFYLRGSGSPGDLAARVKALVPDAFQAQTGDEFRDDQRQSVGSVGRVLKNALTAFAVLALLVGAFVIYNTFSVIVAQRLRELAVLAAIGATPKQIKRSLRWEGVVIGLVGSALGVLTGILLAFLVIAILGAVGFSLPGGGIAITPATVLGGILIGTLITGVSVLAPARKAARTEPIQALRDSAVESTRISKTRIVITAIFLVVGVANLVGGDSGATVGLGAFCLFIGVIIAGPVVARVGTWLVRPVMSRFGLEGRLAVDNTARNPKRTATTANALLIGVFLVTLVTVAGASGKDYVVGELKKIESADYLVSSDGGTLDDAFVAKLRAVKGVNAVSAFRREPVTVDGEASLMTTANLAEIQRIADIEVETGSLDDLGPGTVAVVGTTGIVGGGGTVRAVGDTVTVKGADGSADLKVVAVLKGSLDSSYTGNIVDSATFDRIAGPTAATVAFIDAAPGEQTDTKDAIEALADLRPDVSVIEGNLLGRVIGQVFDFVINAVNGLLLMSVVVALIGIINTLSLSILERRRELGLLRVVGMTDKRVRRMIRMESILIAGLGTVTGLILGGFVGWGLVGAINRASDANVATSFPTTQLLIILVAGVVLGFLASLIPARRSTRLEVLDAIQAT